MEVFLADGIEAHPHIRMQALIFLQQRGPQPIMGFIALQPIHPPLGHHHDVERLPIDQGEGSATLQDCAEQGQQGKSFPQEP